MKLSCEKKVLLPALMKAKHCLTTKGNLPVLETVLLEAEESLRLTTTNLVLTALINCEANIEEPGKLCVDGLKFLEIVRRLPGEEVSFSQKKETLIVDSGKAHFELATIPAEEFPEVKLAVLGEKQANIGELISLMSKVSFCADTDSYKGFNVVFLGDDIIATDGRRLAKVEKLEESDVKASLSVDFVKLLPVMFGKDAGTGKINLKDGRVIFSDGNVTFASQLMEKQAPDWKQIFPTESNCSFKINKQAFSSSVERVALLGDESLAVRLDITDKVILTANSDSGMAREELSVDELKGEVKIAFSARLLRGLEKIDAEELIVKFVSSDSAIVVEPSNPGYLEQGFIFVMMPLKIEKEIE